MATLALASLSIIEINRQNVNVALASLTGQKVNDMTQFQQQSCAKLTKSYEQLSFQLLNVR